MQKSWLPTFLTIALGAVSAATPQIQEEVGKHPDLAISLITAYAVLKGILPPPTPFQPKDPNHKE